jgi:hypothetical protein
MPHTIKIINPSYIETPLAGVNFAISNKLTETLSAGTTFVYWTKTEELVTEESQPILLKKGVCH